MKNHLVLFAIMVFTSCSKKEENTASYSPDLLGTYKTKQECPTTHEYDNTVTITAIAGNTTGINLLIVNGVLFTVGGVNITASVDNDDNILIPSQTVTPMQNYGSPFTISGSGYYKGGLLYLAVKQKNSTPVNAVEFQCTLSGPKQ